MSAHKMAPSAPEKALAAPQLLSFRKRYPRLFRALIAGGIVGGLTLIGGLIIFLPLSIPAMAAVGTGAFILHFGVLPSVGVYVAMSLAAMTITSVIAGFKDKIGGFFGRLFSRKPSVTKKPSSVTPEESETSTEESTRTITRSSSAETLETLGMSEAQEKQTAPEALPSPTVTPKLEKGVTLRPEPEEIYKAALKDYQDHKNEVLKYLDDAIACAKKINATKYRDSQTKASVCGSLTEARTQFLSGSLRGDYCWDTPFGDNPEYAGAHSRDIKEIHAAFDQVRVFLASEEHQLFTDFDNQYTAIEGSRIQQLSDWTKPSSEKEADDFLADQQENANKIAKVNEVQDKKMREAYREFVERYDAWQATLQATEPTTTMRKTR